jgi:hypothetical protein
MARKGSPLGFVVALFDVLGFEYRLNTFGLDEILNRYQKIVDIVNKNTESNKLLDKLNFDSPFWLSSGNVALPTIGVFYNIEAVYSSDSILLWSNLAWKRVQHEPIEVLKKNENHPAYGYLSKPIPMNNFLTMCANIICRSIEIDLPLRGALSMGDALLDKEANIFLGNPIVEAARLEVQQNCIGVGVCNSFEGYDPRFNHLIPYSKHFKAECKAPRKELALNWPLFWKDTRQKDLKSTLEELSEQNDHHHYYTNTIEFVRYSNNFKPMKT